MYCLRCLSIDIMYLLHVLPRGKIKESGSTDPTKEGRSLKVLPCCVQQRAAVCYGFATVLPLGRVIVLGELVGLADPVIKPCDPT